MSLYTGTEVGIDLFPIATIGGSIRTRRFPFTRESILLTFPTPPDGSLRKASCSQPFFFRSDIKLFGSFVVNRPFPYPPIGFVFPKSTPSRRPLIDLEPTAFWFEVTRENV